MKRSKTQGLSRRHLLQGAGAVAGLTAMPMSMQAALANRVERQAPILVAVELSGGNDGLNTVVPYADDAYYRARPNLGIAADQLLKLDHHYGLNPALTGLHKLWQRNQLAIVHGCGYAQPSYSHFTSMAYWHTGVPHRGDEFGWLGRVADALAPTAQDDMLINIGARQSLAVKSRRHTPVVFDQPDRFQRHDWMHSRQKLDGVYQDGAAGLGAGPERAISTNQAFLRAVNTSARQSSARIRQAWDAYSSPVDYGIAPMDLPKVAACIAAGLPTQLYMVSFRNNAFDTHVSQPNLHRRLLSYASDGIYGFMSDLQRLGLADRVLLMVYSEFGRRVPENANMGSDHGSANVMLLAGAGVQGGHYGQPPSLTQLVDGDNLAYTTDFRRVYATAIQGWLGVPAAKVLHQDFEPLPVFS